MIATQELSNIGKPSAMASKREDGGDAMTAIV
jgi:hypothetical protein